ncbi:MAG: hybrid sensor histidine kinase/response regulator [Chloroflexi bacterium]|nr:hybrid sensor histidine kinase/response regulator [Chloroflexota bacterium]
MEATVILFVEDNEDLRENAALVLGLEGYEVQVARDGQEALDMLETGMIPNLIVSDIMMPRMDGYEFFEAVRQKPQLKGVPFIFLTARGSRQDISTGRLLGADDYLVKPFDPEEFLIAIQNKLQRVADMRAQVAESLNDARRVLVQLLSHELRTPLTYVTGGFALLAEELEVIQGPATSDDIRISLDLIQSGTQRLNRLAEQMVLYSELISGYIGQQVKTAGEPLGLDEVAVDAIAALNHFAQEQDVRIQHTYSESEPVIVHGVKDLLVTAFTEIIRNAIQHSSEQSKIELVIDIEGSFGRFAVIDHGQGIRPEDQLNIWDVMVQSERNRTEQQGLGMGLPIVKGITTAHGGDVALYSTHGEGTEVIMRIPLADQVAD